MSAAYSPVSQAFSDRCRSYIANTGYVRTPIVQCNLTALCLQYLTFECFDSDIAEEKLHEFAFEGYFVFQDYAVANWAYHLRAMVEAGEELLAEDTDSQDALLEVNQAMTDFADKYEEDLYADSNLDTSEPACEAFQRYDFYPVLELVWRHIRRHQEKGFDVRNDVSLRLLSDTFFRNRASLEELTSSNASFLRGWKDLARFYGNKTFKCPKVTCFWFHEGFKDKKSRDQHINRHDRPFRCTFPECSVAEFGFGSSKELEKHTSHFHPSLDDQARIFPTLKTVLAKTPHECHMCPKRFTRRFHLRNHIRTHTAEKPYTCSECGKPFTRANDCRRHEKIHARRG